MSSTPSIDPTELAQRRRKPKLRWNNDIRRCLMTQVKVSFDDESLSFWDPFKSTGFNASSTLIPFVNKACRRAPAYVAYAGLSTALKLFLPPNALHLVHVVYVAAALGRSHEDVETFCKNEGTSLLLSPSIQLALVGSALRATRFRTWRRLFVKATLFRLRYQLLFRRIYRPRWITVGPSSMVFIVRDAAAAARSVQGLFPDLCYQTALIASGCRLPYWSDCTPPPQIEKGWGKFRRLDRGLKKAFGERARRVRPGDGRRFGLGLLGWRIPHRVVLKTARLGGGLLSAPIRAGKKGMSRRKARKEKSGKLIELQLEPLGGGDGDGEDDMAVGVLKADEEMEEESGAAGTSVPRGESSDAPTGSRFHTKIPEEGPLIKFHNVTVVVSLGSTLTKSYRALAELPYGDAEECVAWSLIGRPDTTPLRPVIIKRNVPRQLKLAADDIAAARRTLRSMTFRATLDLDLSGVMTEVAAAVARTGDLRVEAHNIKRVRFNLARADMLSSVVSVPDVLSCPEVGQLARRDLLVTTALRGVDVSNSYLMEHAAASGGKERSRFVDGLFAAFGQMCLADGCFPSNPMPDNLLYMYNGQVGVTDLSAVFLLKDDQRRALCRLYRTMEELKNEDAVNPSPAAEKKARAAMEGVGLVIDLPPAGGTTRTSTCVSMTSGSNDAGPRSTGRKPKAPRHVELEEAGASDALAAVGEVFLDAQLGSKPDVEAAAEGDATGEKVEGERQGVSVESQRDDDTGELEQQVVARYENEMGAQTEAEEDATTPAPGALPAPVVVVRSPVTHVMLLRGLFDTQREEALDLLGVGCLELLRGMAVRRLPKAMVPVLRMVANLRGVCSHLDVDKSLLPRFSRAASKGMSWRFALSSSRGRGTRPEDLSLERAPDTPPCTLLSEIYQLDSEPNALV